MKVLRFFEFAEVSTSRWQWIQRCWALFGLLLILATWRLWIPQDTYPQVPLVDVALALPAWGQWAALGVAGCVLVLTLVFITRINDAVRPWWFVSFVVAMVVSILADQHRLQPWAYQFVILALIFGTVGTDAIARRRGVALLRLLTLSIYFYSALGKFDFQFLHTVGQQFLGAAFGFVGLDVELWPWPVRLWLAALFPLAELLLVFLLVVPRFRRIGVAVAVVLHSALLVILGPWGLQHEPGVLIWNACFIAQALLLFSRFSPAPGQPLDAAKAGPASAAPADLPSSSKPPPRRWVPTAAILLVVGLPLLEPSGWFDHWPAWGLYSPRNSRVIVEVHRAGVASLPPELQAHLVPAGAGASWVLLEIDAWSLDALSVPIYPQDRFQLGVAESLAARFRLERTIRVRVLGMSHRLTGARQETILTGRQQIITAANRYRLNTHPAT